MNNHKSTYFLYGPHLSIFMFMYFDSEWEWNLFFLLKFISKIMFHLHVREWHTCEHSREVGKGGGGVSYPPPPPPHFFFNGQPTTLSRLTWTESGQTQLHWLHIPGHSYTPEEPTTTPAHQQFNSPLGVVGSSPLILPCVYRGFLKYFSLTPSPSPNPITPFVKVDLPVFVTFSVTWTLKDWWTNFCTENIANISLVICTSELPTLGHFDPICKDWDTQAHQSD